MNLPTLVVGLIVAAIIVRAVLVCIKAKKKGGFCSCCSSGCSGNCASCGTANSCSSLKKKA